MVHDDYHYYADDEERSKRKEKMDQERLANLKILIENKGLESVLLDMIDNNISHKIM